MYLRDFKCDGLRFDSANDLPADVVQVRRRGREGEGGGRGRGGRGYASTVPTTCLQT